MCGCVRGVNIISVEAILFKYDSGIHNKKKKDVFEYVCVTSDILFPCNFVEATFL